MQVQRSPRFVASLPMAFLATASLGWTATLTVGPGGTFPDIQSAIDAAVDGDLILVEPGTYEPFVIALKGVTVQAESRFTIDDTSGSGVVRILGITPGQKAAITGMDMVSVFGTRTGVEAEFSTGEIIVESVTITDPGGEAFFTADNCSNLFVTELTITGSPVQIGFPVTELPLTIKGSTASFHDLTIAGGGSFEAVRIEDGSNVVVSGPRITGVRGRDSAGCIFDPDGGGGGAAVTVQRASSLIVTGDASHFLAGGAGGAGSPCGSGGTGGPAIIVGGASNVEVALRVALLGGAGGTGGGNDGDPSVGPVDHTQQFPFLDVPGGLQVGGSISIAIDAVPSGAASLTVLAVVSGDGGFVNLAAFGGPAASALPFQPFVLLVGVTDPLGDVTFLLNVPNDASLEGFPVHAQAAVADPLGPNYLTNVVVRGLGS